MLISPNGAAGAGLRPATGAGDVAAARPIDNAFALLDTVLDGKIRAAGTLTDGVDGDRSTVRKATKASSNNAKIATRRRIERSITTIRLERPAPAGVRPA